MITSLDFPKVKYTKPKLEDDRPVMGNIMGFDSEAYTTGEPFMFCLSDGTVLWPGDIPGMLIEEYSGVNFMIYNLKYDSGAILRGLPRDILYSLWKNGKSAHEGYRYTYIPHKLLRISQGKKTVSFWDISQFYACSLDVAAKTYLGKGKLAVRTKRFTPQYVKRFYNSIRIYCVRDAALTKELGEYLIGKLGEFGLTVTSLYSCASISFRYFCEYSKINTAWRYWNSHRDALGYACDAYQGGKFEVTTRGRFTGYEYDITSAYPFEIANLLDISTAKVVYSKVFEQEAAYGYIRCRIDNRQGVHIPCGPKLGEVRMYPAGSFHCTITKAEYEYLKAVGVGVTIHNAAWLFVNRRSYPYREVIGNLFHIKSVYKGKDSMLYHVTKIVQNSYYGKTAQCIEQPDGSIVVGAAWNPFHAAVICANTRLKVTEIQNTMGKDCLAVHTDSVITTTPIDSSKIFKGELGEFELKQDSAYGDKPRPGILIACGMYQIGSKCAYKGFEPRSIRDADDFEDSPPSYHRDTWEEMLTRNLRRSSFNYPELKVESWREAMSKNHPISKINVFTNARKKVDLNCDTKRTWLRKVKARDLLSGSEPSHHKLLWEVDPPEYWKK